MAIFKKSWLLVPVVLAAALVAVWILVPGVKTPETEEVPENISSAGSRPSQWSVNEAGQKWTVSDTADFVVSGGSETGIKFWEGKIDPLKVVPGMTQTMRIVVSSPSGLSSVTAQIETDNGINEVELQKTGVLAARDLDDRHGVYVVNDDGVLAINNREEARAWRLALIEKEESGGLISGALASGGEREIWEGSWVVRDTSVRKYNTAFLARDSAGNENTMNMAWSDPCNQDNVDGIFWPNSGQAILSNTCAISATYGPDDGDLEIRANGQLTLSNDAILAFNPGKKITFTKNLPGDAPTIFILNNASIQKKYLWAVDKDEDHYIDVNSDIDRWVSDSPTVPPNTGQQSRLRKLFNIFIPAQAQSQSDLKRQNTIVSHTPDCDDINYDARPGQTGYFSAPRANGTFDYNCDGSSTMEIEFLCSYTDNFCENDIPIAGGRVVTVWDKDLIDRTGRFFTSICWGDNSTPIEFPDCGDLKDVYEIGTSEDCISKGDAKEYWDYNQNPAYEIIVNCR